MRRCLGREPGRRSLRPISKAMAFDGRTVTEEIMDIRVGDIIKMKKKHPCGSFEWEVLRIGADFRLKCTGCGHQIMIPRPQAEKNIRGITRNTETL